MNLPLAAALSLCLFTAAPDTPASPASPSAAEIDRWLSELQITAPPAELGLTPFYKKHVSALGVSIVSSDKVHDAALLEAAYLTRLMLEHRRDLTKAMERSHSRIAVMAHNEWTTDLPEFADMTPKDYWDRRARGMGGMPHRRVTTVGEENLLQFEGDPYWTESIFIHEFAHGIHNVGLDEIEPEFDRRLKAHFEDVTTRGLWKGKYAAKNRAEYWAEVVQSYFGTNRPPDHDHNHVDTRPELAEYDPAGERLVAEVFRNASWTFTPTKQRAHQPHLKNLDRSKLPKFAWPERLAEESRKLDEMKKRRLQEQEADAKAKSGK